MTQTNHYCVPTALSILTAIPVDAVEKILKDVYLGDVQISGVYLGLALKFLSDNGYHWVASVQGEPLIKFIDWSEDRSYLIELHGHAIIYKCGKIYDNTYQNGITVGRYPRRNEKILRAYRISHA